MDNLELILVFVVIFVIVPILLALLKNEQQKQKKNKKTTKKQIALKMVTCLACEKNGSDEMFKELQKLVALNYSELVDYLLQKYGPAKND